MHQYDHSLREKRLWLAVINQALIDSTTSAKEMDTPIERPKARRWLTSDGDDFRMVCEMAGLNPDYVQRKVLVLLSMRGKIGTRYRSETETTKAEPRSVIMAKKKGKGGRKC
jgi:hypothetical protein